MTSFKGFIAGSMCILLSTLPAFSEPQAGAQAGAQRAGEIDALIPAATRNAQTASVKEELDWNDLLKTQHSGRVRAGLTDGSILSVGTDSELRVVQQDSTSQQTSLEMDFGKVRMKVAKITKPGGKFELKTPNAVIGVIGTDVYAGFSSNRTTVICYEGTVWVTPVGAAQAIGTAAAAAATGQITLSAGQMVVITSKVPPTGFHSSDTPPNLAQSSMLSTDVPDNGAPLREVHPPAIC